MGDVKKDMLYSALVFIQIIAIISCFACLVIMFQRDDNNLVKMMLVSIACSLIQNAGYLLELQSNNIEEAMIAIRMEYLGAAFITYFIFIFICKYCRAKTNRFMEIALFIVCITTFVTVWLYESTGLYYRSVNFVDTGMFPHFESEKGPVYFLYSAVLVCELFGCCYITMKRYIQAPAGRLKNNYFLLFLSVLIPVVFYSLSMAGVLGDFDATPLGSAVGVTMFGVASIKQNFFDVADLARRGILMGLDDAVIIVDQFFILEDVNERATKIFPKINSDMIGCPVPMEVRGLFYRDETKEHVVGDRFYDIHVNKIKSDNKKVIGYCAIMFDVTDKKHQMEKMLELKEEATLANKAKSDFLAHMSHEIRTPINAVIGLNEVILRDFTDPVLLDYSTNIKNAANTLLYLINDILDFSKIEAGKFEIIPREYNLAQFFSEVIKTNEFRAKKKGLEFKFAIDENIPKYMIGDEVRLRQVMNNFISNAIKYTKEGEVLLTASFESLGKMEGILKLSVKDTGIGIRKEDKDKLFGGFVRLEEEKNRHIEGTGLGLNITKQIVDLMNGHIEVISEYGKGSEFIAYVPQSLSDRSDATIGKLVSETKKTKISKVDYKAKDARILIVDDTKTNLIVAEQLLKRTEAKITKLSSGQECLDIIMKEHFDLIYLDHRMPNMDGIETLHKMKEMNHLCKDTPVIVLTANTVNNVKEMYLQEGFDDFLSKPITEESITSMTKAHLRAELIVDN